jgi:squalene cyclase
MKTTVEITDGLLEEARKAARRERTSVRALIEEGLRSVLSTRRQPKKFRLRKVTCGGRGLQKPLTEQSWERIREMAYEGRGA